METPLSTKGGVRNAAKSFQRAKVIAGGPQTINLALQSRNGYRYRGIMRRYTQLGTHVSWYLEASDLECAAFHMVSRRLLDHGS